MLYIDVSSTLRRSWTTGIQRVVRSLALRLAAELPQDTKLISYDQKRELYHVIPDSALIDSRLEIDLRKRRYLDRAAFIIGDIFLDVDATWDDELDRSNLFRDLKRRGVIIVAMHYDAIPILFPELGHTGTVISFPQYLARHLQYADYVLTASTRVAQDLQSIAQRHLSRRVATHMIKLGADFDSYLQADSDTSQHEELSTSFPELKDKRYLLAVGTVEPRKNYKLLLEVFQRLDIADAALAIVGRRGWASENFLKAYQSHPEFGKRMFWYPSADDQDLQKLYRHAHASVMTSYYEGFGLPAVEALRHGCPTVCSDGGALPEVVGNFAPVFKSGDADALFDILDRIYRDPIYHEQLRFAARSFAYPTWAEAGTHAASVIRDIRSGQSHDFSAPLRQMVYLSSQPDVLDLSLQSVRKNLPFIDRLVILTEGRKTNMVKSIAERYFAEAIIIANEELESQSSNTLLRKTLYAQPCIEPNFLAAEETAIALRPIESTYYLRAGVHSGFYFLDDIAKWLGQSPHPTILDISIRNTWRVLREAGYPARFFASGMPQIINKSACNMIFDRFVSNESHDVQEWTLYFNVASHLFPQLFSIQSCETLGWPSPTIHGLTQVNTSAAAFECYCPHHYKEQGIFFGLAPLEDFTAKVARTRAQASTVDTFALLVTPNLLTFIGPGRVLAGERNVQCVLLVNGAKPDSVRGQLKMWVNDSEGTMVRSEAVTLQESYWVRLLPPAHPGSYELRFQAELESGALLRASAPLSVVTKATC